MEREGKTKEQIEFVFTAKRHGFEIINLKK